MAADISLNYPRIADGIENPLIRKERNQMMEDLCFDRIPSHVPVRFTAHATAALEFAGLDIKKYEFDPAAHKTVTEKINQVFYSDFSIVPYQYPYIAYKITGYVHQEPSEEGILEHRNYTYSSVEDYKEYIKDPYSYMVNVLMPRKHKHLNGTAMENAVTLLRAYIAQKDYDTEMFGIIGDLNRRYNYENYFKILARTLAPFDYVADIVRSFPDSLVDIRRNPELILEATNKTLEYKKFKVDHIHASGPECFTRIPLHMPTFMNKKAFEKFWWPSFKEMGEYIVASGKNMQITLEDNWSHLLDFAQDIPGRPYLSIELANDIQLFKDKLGKGAILEGMFPLETFLMADEKTLLDEIKRYIDILAPGGNYVFAPNKVPLRLCEMNVPNLIAGLNFAHEYGKYN